MAGMTQSERVLRHLKDYGSITPVEALAEYGIMRLGARIWDLKKQGHVIVTERETGVNRYGERTAYARYRVERGIRDIERPENSPVDCS